MMKTRYAGMIFGAALLAVPVGTPARADDAMKLTLNFLAQPAQAGFFLAKEKGYYKDVGIDLTIVEGKGSSTTAQITAAGQDDVGFINGGIAISFINKGAPLQIIAEPIQGNFMSLGFLAKEDIKKPQDLIGKTIAVCPGCAQIPMLKAMLAKANIDQSKVKIINVDQSAHVSMLEEGKIDAAAGDPNSISIEMKHRGDKVANMFFQDWGIQLVNFVIAARTDKLKANPDLYKRFVAASLKGWHEVLVDPEGAISALQHQYPEIKLDRKTLMEQLEVGIAPFICVKDSPGVGKASPQLWATTYDVMKNYMGLKATVPVDKVYTDAYLPAQLPACK
ncbi:MAG TPA: ABC transporter substrate-binding protein [Rhizobiaceae bacterium]|jgi:NitT/TauT family transport system substrate-binding protein|nr:ABC transporter substrate-binding protein [Rhizobiaceae bacterium]